MNQYNLDSIKSFVLQNGLIVAIAGITVGSSTKDVIKAFAIDILMPSFHFLIIQGILKPFSPKYYNVMTKIFGENRKFLWTTFLKELIVWFFIVTIAYIIIELLLNKLFVKSTDPEVIEEENKKFFKFQHSFLVPGSNVNSTK